MPSSFMAFIAFSTSSTLLPLVSVMPYLSRSVVDELPERPALPGPDHEDVLGPGLSLSAPMIFWIGAVKSVAFGGGYSSWTTLAPSFSTAAL